jgi:hypothetical protein
MLHFIVELLCKIICWLIKQRTSTFQLFKSMIVPFPQLSLYFDFLQPHQMETAGETIPTISTSLPFLGWRDYGFIPSCSNEGSRLDL